MKLTFLQLDYYADAFRGQVDFGNPLNAFWEGTVQKEGFSHPRALARWCMGWLWYQWLLKGDIQECRKCAEAFVIRGLRIRELSSHHCMRSIHDLYLLHCAIFGCNNKLLLKVAECVDVAPSNKPETRPNHGERYAAAYSGMLKFRILGDEKKAAQQFDLIWSTYRGDPSFRAAPKPLVAPWLKKDWKTFAKFQLKDFERLWSQARKHHLIHKETEDEMIVALKMYPVEDAWCWAHCGLALLAHRQFGVDVATDTLWFPPHALKVVPRP